MIDKAWRKDSLIFFYVAHTLPYENRRESLDSRTITRVALQSTIKERVRANFQTMF